MAWNEDKYEHQNEIKRAQAHDCIKDRENCDEIHPNIAGFTITWPSIARPNQNHPSSYRNWILDPKALIGYTNRHTLKSESFNVSEAFLQMGTNGRLNVVHNIIEYCLDDDERSMLFADLTNRE